MKLVVLENAQTLPNSVLRIIRDLDPAEQRVFTRFEYIEEHELPYFSESLVWCDTILSQTTLNNKWQIDEMVKMMEKLPSKQIIFNYKSTVEELFRYLDRREDDEDYADISKIDHHQIGYYESAYDDAIVNSPLFKEKGDKIRLVLANKAEELRIKKLQEKKYRDEAIKRKTGQTVKVNRILAYGPQFSTLVPGTTVEVLDMTHQDPEPYRGIWVWGNGEPVKLINDAGYNEYTLVTNNKRDIAIEILKMADPCTGEFTWTDNDIFSVIGFIDDAMSEENVVMTLHDNITVWLDERDLPRRKYRMVMKNFICRSLNLV